MNERLRLLNRDPTFRIAATFLIVGFFATAAVFLARGGIVVWRTNEYRYPSGRLVQGSEARLMACLLFFFALLSIAGGVGVIVGVTVTWR